MEATLQPDNHPDSYISKGESMGHPYCLPSTLTGITEDISKGIDLTERLLANTDWFLMDKHVYVSPHTDERVVLLQCNKQIDVNLVSDMMAKFIVDNDDHEGVHAFHPRAHWNKLPDHMRDYIKLPDADAVCVISFPKHGSTSTSVVASLTIVCP